MAGSAALALSTRAPRSATRRSRLRTACAGLPRHNDLEELPDQIGDLRACISLNCAFNKLKELPTSLTRLRELVRLNVSNNALTGLPRGFGGMNNLIYLDLSNNALTELSGQIGLLNTLVQLYVSDNQLEELPAEIERLQNLEVLYCTNNKLKVIPTQIGACQSLRSLSFLQNDLTCVPAELGRLEGIELLYLGGNPLFDELLEKYIEGLPALKAYLVSDAYREDARAQYVASCAPAPRRTCHSLSWGWTCAFVVWRRLRVVAIEHACVAMNIRGSPSRAGGRAQAGRSSMTADTAVQWCTTLITT